MEKKNPVFVVSACLAGELCRYDARMRPDKRIVCLVESGRAVAVCPEVLGGLGVPRVPCEIQGGRVVSKEGVDCTDAYRLGARKALEQAKAAGATAAVLKARSPACGTGSVYDGSFSKTLCSGDGVFAALLRQEGFRLFSEESEEFLGE